MSYCGGVRFRGFIFGVFFGVLLVAFALYGYFTLGFAPATVAAPPMPFERMLARRGLRAASREASSLRPPFEATETRLMEGAKIYRSACAGCHNLPGQSEPGIREHMYPRPPVLLTGKGVTDDPVGRTYWVVRNGIRLTGMPAFEGLYSEEQLWDVSLLLAKANQLPDSVRQSLTRPDNTATPGNAPKQQ